MIRKHKSSFAKGVQAIREGRVPYRIARWLRAESYIRVGTDIVFQLVQLTTPVESTRDADLECVTLLNGPNVAAYLVAVKSFLHFSGRRARITVISDGSISPGGIALLQKHVRSLRILQPDDFCADPFTCPEQLHSLRRGSIHTRKLLDLPFADLAPSVLFLDSDVIFRRPIDQDFFDLSDVLCRYNRDHDHRVHDKMFHLVERFLDQRANGQTLVHDLNSGLVLFDRRALRPDVVEEFFVYLNQREAIHYVMEQDCCAVLASLAGARAFSDRYWVGCNPDHVSEPLVRREAIAKHYVGGVRYRNFAYATDFLRVLPGLLKA